MSQKIDPTGFPKGVWGVVLDYTAPSTQDAIVYKVNYRPSPRCDWTYNLQGGPFEEVRFDYGKILQTFKDYLEFGQYYDLPKVDQQIRMFAMKSFVLGFINNELLRDRPMNLRVFVIVNMNMGYDFFAGSRSMYPLLQQLGLIGQRVVEGRVIEGSWRDDGNDQYFALPQPDEPKEPVRLEKNDVTIENVTPPQS